MQRNLKVRIDKSTWPGTGMLPSFPATFKNGQSTYSLNIPAMLLMIGYLTTPTSSTGVSLSEFRAWVRYLAAIANQSDLSLTQEAYAAGQDAAADAVLVDVRRAGMFEQASTMIPGATWRDPAKVGDWAESLPADKEIVVYCVYGHEVSRSTAMRLRGQGLNARYMAGGIDEWQKSGRPLVPKGTKT